MYCRRCKNAHDYSNQVPYIGQRRTELQLHYEEWSQSKGPAGAGPFVGWLHGKRKNQSGERDTMFSQEI